ncbi:MAG TPA: response regulator transcription factor [Nitrospiria bacterium]|nr:response regulator transcription factor [Nitrospiria bacterium]
MRRARVIVADDHRMVTEGLRGVIEREFDLVEIVEDGQALLKAVQRQRPDLVVLDVSMPGLNGIDAAEQLRKHDPNLKIVFLTMHRDVLYVKRAFENGASGYVLKHSAPAELITAMREALEGRTYVTPTLVGDASELLTDRSFSRRPRPSALRLTPRRREVLQLVAEGRSAKEVASILHISPRTVEYHKYRIMDDFNLRTTADVIQFALRHGLGSI